MYLKLVLATCILAFCAVVLSAYARLADAGLGCANWPACYEENALKERQPPDPGAARTERGHTSWQWKLHSQVVQILGLLAIAVCGLAWKKRRELQPLLPTLLVALMAFMAVFGIWAFGRLSRPVIVTVHLASGVTMLVLLTWILLRHLETAIGWTQKCCNTIAEAGHFRTISMIGMVVLLTQIMLGGWVSSNFAALACNGFPLCQGALLPAMDFSYSSLPLTPEKLAAIHWMHRLGALLTIAYLGWMSLKFIAVKGVRNIGKTILGLLLLQFVLGVCNVLLGLPLLVAVLHNAVAMLLLVMLVVLNFRLRNTKA